MDYNMILGECEELSDWGNGYKIALTLLNRYQLPAFDFQSSADAAPNTRTIHLMLTMFLKYDHVTMARRLFSTLRGRYPHSIPLDVYASFLQELASMEGQSSRIVSFLNEMHQYGPTPTTTIYNTLLKSIGRQDGLDKAEGVLRWMKNHELEADQQSYRILMQLSLTELNLNRAHYWLAEYERQGFEINPRMLEPFMKTCIREVVSGSSKAADPGTYSREWMYNCLQLWQFMANEGMTPTPGTFDMMIEGLLSQRNLPEARKTLNLMRNCPHMYIPAPRTWTLFFDYYLQVDDYLAAMRILNEMRRAGSAAPKPKFSSGNAVPTKMYHRLFEYMLRRGKLSLAERNLYVMLIRQNRAQPTETEVVDLIWEMNGQPEDAERVYELLYSQTGDLSFDEINFKPVRTNMILQHGPIQLANVGVMRAKATSNREALHDEVRMNWRSMTKYFSEQEQRNQRNPEQAQEESPSQRKIKFLLALAFEQVARACRRTTIYDHELALAQREEAREKEEAEEEARNGWDFNRSRRSLGLSVSGLGLGLGRPGASAVSSARPLEFFKSKHRMLIQQLLKNQAFLQPLVSRRNNNNDSSKTTMFSVVSMEERLKDLKSSFEWVQEHKIPIRTDGFNAYLESLISHRDFDTARDTIERFLLHPSSLPHIDHALGNKKDRLRPDLGTIKILNVNKGILFEGKELMDQTLRAGGPWLSREWEQYLQSCHPRGPNHTRTSFKTEMRAKYRTPLPSSVDSSAITQGTPSSCSM
ncbi:hypothetical protein BGX28_005249 [Mortierella sp. GBA30]|nr:hypothetical protein BGX28_005249 [Mortierella sp. GBA30]